MGKISYTINEEKRIVYTKCTGELTLEDLKKHASSVIMDPNFHPDMNSISDTRETELENSFLTLFAFRDHLRNIEHVRGGFKWAIIINAKSPDAIELFKALASDGVFSIKLFENRNEAEKWISKTG